MYGALLTCTVLVYKGGKVGSRIKIIGRGVIHRLHPVIFHSCLTRPNWARKVREFDRDVRHVSLV